MVEHMKRDVRDSPWGAAAFMVSLLLLVLFTVDRFGLFAPGPVLRNLEVHASIDAAGETVLFRVEGDKVTNDTLKARVASWIFSDGTAMAVAMDGNAPVPNRQAGDHFVSQEYSARIPSAARTDAGSRLRVCFVYDPGLSCTEARLQDIAG